MLILTDSSHKVIQRYCSGECGPEPKSTLLGFAVDEDNKEATELLINAGADPDRRWYVYLELGMGSRVVSKHPDV